ncbi:hypothetical protein N7460_009980 [Penicillium canescens]|uniref:Uncharacterized protein n=1 Tax=Penicillium canescens TaxID=5083 RepID=A0AAD6N5M9_PENCN|nr:hypothetical protein N7460_009980 [Penicillium canescens]KAJ6174732.1 hypothetical protein N7485_005176 [Penicillium canescens]
MGVAATKVVCSDLSQACINAERNGISRLDPDLICQSDAFVKAAKALLKQLPVQLKARPSRTLLASERLDTIRLPEELEAEFRIWREDPQMFHLSLAERISSPPTVTRLQIPPIAEVYIRCSEADCTATLESVRLRFYCVIFYDLKEEITPNQPLTSEILNLITAAIGKTGAVDGFNETKTRKKIKEWIKAGAKFSSLAKDLNGRGALFFTTLSKSHVLNHLPESRDHPDRKELISSLLKRGIAREATKLNANTVADKIIAHHLGPLRATLVEGIRKGLSEVYPAPRRKKTPSPYTQPDADSPSSGLGNENSSGIDNEELSYEEGSVTDLGIY